MKLLVIYLIVMTLLLTTCNVPGSPTSTTVTPAITHEPTATPAPAEDTISATTFHSPDGQWLAETHLSDSSPGHTHVRFRVARTDGAVDWDIVNEDRPQGLGFPSPAVLHWWPEEPRLYYTEASLPGGCPLALYHTGLYEVDLTNGNVAQFSNVEGYLAVSPAADRIAYWPGGPMRHVGLIHADWQLVLLNLATGEQQPVSLELDENARIVNFVWSPDATSLLLVTAASDGCPALDRSVLLIDLESDSVSTLIGNSPEPLYVVKWAEPDVAILHDGKGIDIELPIRTE